MPEVYLHIGTQKTGTTALQQFLTDNREALLAQDLDYPSSEEFLTMPGLNRTRNGIWINRTHGEAVYDTYCDRMLAHCAQHGRVLFSDEDLYRGIYRYPERLRTLHDRLKKRGIGLKVIIYLRRQDEYLSSLWAFQTKVNGTLTLEEWLMERDIGHLGDYASFLSLLSHEIGPDNILIRAYERDRFKGGTIYEDFLDLFGIGMSEQYRLPEKELNPSLTDVCLEVRRRLNRMPGGAILREESETDPASYRRALLVKNALLEVQKQMQEEGTLQHRSFFKPGQRQELLDRFREGNEAISADYLQGEPLFHRMPAAEEESAHITEAEIEAVYQRMLLVLGGWAAQESPTEDTMVGNMPADELIRRQKEQIRELEEQMRLRNLPKLVVRKLRKRRNGKKRKNHTS